MNGIIGLLVTILILALICGLIWYVIGLIPLPQPFANIVKAVFAVIVLLILIGVLLGYVPALPYAYPRRVSLFMA